MPSVAICSQRAFISVGLTMERLTRNSKGFTLLEILIVLVILAVIASVAIPVYTSSVNKLRAQEALVTLAAIRDSYQRYFWQNSTYAGAVITFPAVRGSVSTITGLDFNPNVAAAPGVVRCFDYETEGHPGVGFVIVGEYNTGLAGCSATATGGVRIDQTGAVVNNVV